jgi:hypothetical protein
VGRRLPIPELVNAATALQAQLAEWVARRAAPARALRLVFGIVTEGMGEPVASLEVRVTSRRIADERRSEPQLRQLGHEASRQASLLEPDRHDLLLTLPDPACAPDLYGEDDIHADDQLDEEQMASWIRQADSSPGRHGARALASGARLFHHPDPMDGQQQTIRRLHALDARAIEALGDVLIDCVESGASVSFMQPMTRGRSHGARLRQDAARARRRHGRRRGAPLRAAGLGARRRHPELRAVPRQPAVRDDVLLSRAGLTRTKARLPCATRRWRRLRRS